uniref:Uncharacterized protein n=1 Tax=Chromera velia CCMP2878 TaxID=1169474 RepID=A0A0G4I6M1_9ALVE|mmetsp:Transcript_1446/g.3005  ORF Transcript_1446/g.3005 Transcript_1446/m.3005 type:complete len:222 (+) Transcript_1446:170-835(+)|eukprot:Cvel_11409.t1-p1 / transcript=Cvel_11409.t1 / gene=Cvel_11409 / organism=Chromera_velia_CCMP2878 / gene_product=hypothetical protein / transcript_product=hypothetical protein / location=Cvel_scaffold716:63446-64728(-) / protein_length=221 / sequence_SO=supercontig / SO=protein_coding / is_pseudo=false
MGGGGGRSGSASSSYGSRPTYRAPVYSTPRTGYTAPRYTAPARPVYSRPGATPVLSRPVTRPVTAPVYRGVTRPSRPYYGRLLSKKDQPGTETPFPAETESFEVTPDIQVPLHETATEERATVWGAEGHSNPNTYSAGLNAEVPCIDVADWRDSVGRGCVEYGANPVEQCGAAEGLSEGGLKAVEACCACKETAGSGKWQSVAEEEKEEHAEEKTESLLAV